VLVGYNIPGGSNYCSGQGGFDNCTFNGSPSIAYTADLTSLVVSTNFPTVDLSDFTFTDETPAGGETNSQGSWTYSPDVSDPIIRYWLAKDGSGGTNAYWLVDSSVGACTEGIDPSNENSTCLDAAVAAYAGSWVTPNASSGNPSALSELAFFDSGSPPNPITDVPIPAALPLFVSGLAGMGLIGWRKRRKAT
jgi:hypothetical protein